MNAINLYTSLQNGVKTVGLNRWMSLFVPLKFHAIMQGNSRLSPCFTHEIFI
jgi:hypothetical protein